MADRPPMWLSVLGPLEVARGAEPVRLGSPQQRRVLAVLVVNANEVVSSDRLVDVLWGEESPRSATHTLHALVSRLRATLGEDRLETCPPGYRLRVSSGEVDALRFEELVRVGLGSSQPPEIALDVFDEALGLWRGSPYAEFAGEEFAIAEVARLVELRARAVEERAAALLELGRPEEVIGELETEIALQPFRERLRALLMLALARAGRPVESLRAYDAFRRFLADEVGVVPSPGMQALNDDIVRQHPDVGWVGSSTRETVPKDPPSGTVTFLFTDLEGSTRLWQEHPDAMKTALARHDEILRQAVTEHDGHVVKTTGDGIHAVFGAARDALDAAVAMQLELGAESFGETGPLRVRIGVHTCETQYRDGDYFGSEVNRAARLMSVAHGGQVVVSLATNAMVRDGTVELVDLGEHRLRDLATVERVFQVAAPGLAREFPPLQSDDMLPGNLPRQMTTFVGREAQIASLDGTRPRLDAGDADRGRWRRQDPPRTPDRRRSHRRVPRWCVVVRVRAGHRPGGGVGDAGRVPAGAAAAGSGARRVGARLSRGQAAVVGARQLRASPRCGRASGGRDRASLPPGVGAGDEPRGPRVGGRADRRGSAAERPGQRRRRRRAPPGGRGAPVLRSGERGEAATSRSPTATSVLSGRCAGASMGSHSRSSSRRRGCRSLSPDDLVSRLDQRFKLLTHGSRAALERHQTLRSTIDWSYDLLTPTERHALQRLAVFAGGCDLAAAEAVLPDDELDATDVVDVLGQLVDKSLVVADDADGPVRYRLLETIRQYARERLDASGDPGALRRRHADHYIALAEAAGPHLRRREHLEWTNVIERDIDNYRAALDWAVETPSPDHGLRLVAAFAVPGPIGDTVVDWAATALAIPGGDAHPLVPVVAAWAAWGATMGHDFERAEDVPRGRGTSPSDARNPACVRDTGSRDPRVLPQRLRGHTTSRCGTRRARTRVR